MEQEERTLQCRVHVTISLLSPNLLPPIMKLIIARGIKRVYSANCWASLIKKPNMMRSIVLPPLFYGKNTGYNESLHNCQRVQFSCTNCLVHSSLQRTLRETVNHLEDKDNEDWKIILYSYEVRIVKQFFHRCDPRWMTYQR